MKPSIETGAMIPIERFASAFPSPDELMIEYNEFLVEEPEIREEALKAAAEMANVPYDSLDAQPINAATTLKRQKGKVGRRAPANPFHSPMLGRLNTKKGVSDKVQDPALLHIPLRGKLIGMLAVNATLFMVFFQALVNNKTTFGEYYAPRSENPFFGPSAKTLYDLGGLNGNAVRTGEWVRLFWAPWMHSGWVHIFLNIVCLLQYFYMLEPDWGTFRTILVFWLSGLTGNFLSVVMDPCKTTVGASGGLFGLMGAVVPYCIEYWHTIPRPGCILIFSLVTAAITIATGLSPNTDTWAHLGGFIGGLLFGFLTLTNPANFLPKEKPVKKTVKKNRFMRWFQRHVDPDCKCGIREWSIRLTALGLAVILVYASIAKTYMQVLMWALCLVYLVDKYEYQPVGSLTYRGITQCCCGYDPLSTEHIRANWICQDCAFSLGDITWGDWVNAHEKQRRLLDDDVIFKGQSVKVLTDTFETDHLRRSSRSFMTRTDH